MSVPPFLSRLTPEAASAILDARLALPAAAEGWLRDELAAIAAGDATALALALGRCGRICAGSVLVPPPFPRSEPWTQVQAVRVRLVLALPAADPGLWLTTLDRLFGAASLEELVALNQGLSCYPHPALLVPRARAGLRHSAESVFAAVALDNPFPAEHLPDEAIDQLVLKAFSIGAEVERISGLDRRCRPHLGRLLEDYRRERIAAGRPVDPRLAPLIDRCAASFTAPSP